MDITPQALAVLNDLRDTVNANAKEKGFYDKFTEGLTEEQIAGPLGLKLRAAVFMTNLHGECSEFWEAYRKGKLDKACDKAHEMVALGLPGLTCAEEEIADIIIRALDTACAFNIDVAKAVAVKHLYNRTRPALHGNKQA